jgi:hypothetical protein
LKEWKKENEKHTNIWKEKQFSSDLLSPKIKERIQEEIKERKSKNNKITRNKLLEARTVLFSNLLCCLSILPFAI